MYFWWHLRVMSTLSSSRLSSDGACEMTTRHFVPWDSGLIKLQPPGTMCVQENPTVMVTAGLLSIQPFPTRSRGSHLLLGWEEQGYRCVVGTTGQTPSPP